MLGETEFLGIYCRVDTLKKTTTHFVFVDQRRPFESQLNAIFNLLPAQKCFITINTVITYDGVVGKLLYYSRPKTIFNPRAFVRLFTFILNACVHGDSEKMSYTIFLQKPLRVNKTFLLKCFYIFFFKILKKMRVEISFVI